MMQQQRYNLLCGIFTKNAYPEINGEEASENANRESF